MLKSCFELRFKKIKHMSGEGGLPKEINSHYIKISDNRSHILDIPLSTKQMGNMLCACTEMWKWTNEKK